MGPGMEHFIEIAANVQRREDTNGTRMEAAERNQRRILLDAPMAVVKKEMGSTMSHENSQYL